MEYCYRSTPRELGAFIDSLYQNPTLMLLVVVGILGIGGYVWRKKQIGKI